MRYFKWVDEYSEIAGGATFVEADSGRVIREITVNGEQYKASNLVDALGRPQISEAQINYDEFDDVTEIEQAEFEEVWDRFLERHVPEWLITKRKFPTGSNVTGWIMFIFPQGTSLTLETMS